MFYIVLDLEMNPIIHKHKEARLICKNEIVEIGAVLLNEQYKEISTYRSYVKPQYNNIARKYEMLTGVTNKLVEKAPSFPEALTDFSNWSKQFIKDKDNLQIYAWSDNDERQLRKEIRLKNLSELNYYFLSCPWYDLQREYCDLLGLKKLITLDSAVGAMGEKFVGRKHDALWDAKNTAHIFSLSRDKEHFKKVMMPIIKVLNQSTPLTYSLGDVLKDKLQELDLD